MQCEDFIHRLKTRTAKLAIGPSTLRGKGNTGAVETARLFLENLDLKTLAVQDESTFIRQLDVQTENLRKNFPAGGPDWGGARKSINIFLRDVIYNTDLVTWFNLSQVRPWLEVPLDSQVAAWLQMDSKAMALPPWPGVKYLQPAESEKYQQAAILIAKAKQVTRVDLDVYYWRNSPAQQIPGSN